MSTTISEDTVIREMLLTSVSCGDADLLKLLEDNIDIILLMNNGCHQEVDYLKSQLSMIDIAMIYSRNRVDEARTRARSTGFDQYRAKYENESLAQRTSESRTCAFADATSFQNFQRDAVNRMRSQSDMESNSSGSTQTTRWDRSTQSASGYSIVADFASSSSTGEGRGSSLDVQINSGKSYSKTSRDFGPNLNDLDTGTFINPLPSPGDIGTFIKDAFIWSAEELADAIGRALGFASTGGGGAFPTFPYTPFDETIDDTHTHQPVENVTDEPFLSCCCNIDGEDITDCPGLAPSDCQYDYINPFPSYGRGYNVKYNISIGIPWIGVLRVDWGFGEQFRQSHTMTQGCTRSTGEGSTNNVYDQADFSDSEGSTETHDESQTTRDMHAIGDSRRDSRSDTTAGSATTGDAHSESHTGSDRASHSERRAGNQGTAWSKGRGRGDGLSTSDSESKTEVRHWSQIFKNLLEMYNRIFDQIIDFDRIRSLSVGIAIGNIETCQYSLPKDPIIAAQLRKGGLTKVYH